MTVTMPSRRHITTAAHAMHIDPDALISYRVDREDLVVCSQVVCLEPAAPRQDLVLVHQKTEGEFKPDIQQGRARSRPASAPSCPGAGTSPPPERTPTAPMPSSAPRRARQRPRALTGCPGRGHPRGPAQRRRLWNVVVSQPPQFHGRIWQAPLTDESRRAACSLLFSVV